MKFLSKVEKSKDFWFLLITSFIFFLLRLPSLFEPYWYGDEGIYEVLGTAIRQGRTLYEGIWDNKPPMLYWIYAIVDGDQFYARTLSLIFGVAGIISFYFLSKKLFGDDKRGRKIAMWSSGVFAALFGLPIIEGNIANAENFMLFPIILSAYLLLKDKLNSKIYLLSGLLLGISFLFKIVAIFDLAAFMTFIIVVNTGFSIKRFNLIKIIRESTSHLIPLVIGFLIPILVTSLLFVGPSFKYFFQATFVQNVGYVGYGNKLIIPQGFLILKLVLLAGFNLYLLLRKDKFSKSTLFILIWLSFSIFNAFFAQRAYTHYLLTLLPSFCLLIGLIMLEKKYKLQLTVLFAISFILIFSKFGPYGKTPFYYQNFLAFLAGGKTVSQYREFFDRKTPLDYQIAGYIKANTNSSDKIFIWGNNSQVYRLTNKIPPGRYAVAYHITGFKDGIENTQQALYSVRPKLIIVMPNVPTFPFSLSGYGNAVNIENAIIYERLF